MPPELVFEIGTEEIPASFVDLALAYLESHGTAKLADARLAPEGVQVFGTPRRLALCVASLAEMQPDIKETVVGPPARIAFDDSGQPTKAAQGFAKKNGADVSQLTRGEVAGKKGEYVLCPRLEKGLPAREVLPELLTSLLSEIPWPKSMRWGAGSTTFARPVHWLVCLFGGERVPLSFAGIESGGQTRGHRFLAPQPVALRGTQEDYVSTLREAFVIVSPKERQNMVRGEIKRVEDQHGVHVRPDDELVAEVANLVEYPVGVLGEFDASFLEVPEEAVVSAMRAHQRYFATERKDGSLAPTFVTIAGTVTKDVDTVKAGNERVLAARLADAKFFFDEDRKSSLEQMSEKLHGVVFQAKLGTVAEKVARVAGLSRKIAQAVKCDADVAVRAASLCKADLVSHMVYEFPDLQGVMGKYMAQADNEPAGVANAIEEHYWPRGAGTELPASAEGAAVAIADRMDTVVGCFAAGLAPTGSADPYALRRATLGVIGILAARQWSALRVSELVDWAAEQLAGTIDCAGQREELLGYFRTRMRGVLEATDLAVDCVDAALSSGYDDIPDAFARAEAVSKLRRRSDFEPLAAAFKRVGNILKGAAPKGTPDPSLFAEEQERALWTAFEQIQSRVEQHLKDRDYESALAVLTELKAPVDGFFDSVLVMDKNERVKENRLAMLGCINRTFNQIADFRQLAV